MNSGKDLNLEFSQESFENLKNEYVKKCREFDYYEKEMNRTVEFLKNESRAKDMDIQRLEMEVQRAKQFDDAVERLSTAKSTTSHRSNEVNVEAMIALEEENAKLREELEAFSYLKQENIEQIEIIERQKEEIEKLRRVNNSRIETTEVKAEALMEDMKTELIETKQILREEAYKEVGAVVRSAMTLNERLAKHLKFENGHLYDCYEQLRHTITSSHKKELAAEEIQQGIEDRSEKITELDKKLQEQKTIIQEMTSKNFLSEFQVKKFQRSQREERVEDLKHLKNKSHESADAELSSIWKTSFSGDFDRTETDETDLTSSGNLYDPDRDVRNMMKGINLPKSTKKRSKRRNYDTSKSHVPRKRKKPTRTEMQRSMVEKKLSVLNSSRPKDRYTNFKYTKKRRTVKYGGALQLIGVRKQKPMFLE